MKPGQQLSCPGSFLLSGGIRFSERGEGNGSKQKTDWTGAVNGGGAWCWRNIRVMLDNPGGDDRGKASGYGNYEGEGYWLRVGADFADCIIWVSNSVVGEDQTAAYACMRRIRGNLLSDAAMRHGTAVWRTVFRSMGNTYSDSGRLRCSNGSGGPRQGTETGQQI